MIRIALILALLVVGLAATGAALVATGGQGTGNTAAPAKTAAPVRGIEKSSPTKKLTTVTARVVNTHGQGVPNIEVEVFEFEAGREIQRYRSGTDGRVQIPVDIHNTTQFLARPEGQTLGWGFWARSQQQEGSDEAQIPLVLLPRSHHVKGSVVDTVGRPVRGVQVRVLSVLHETNHGASDPGSPQEIALLGSAITDEAGQFVLSLPEKTAASLAALHPRFVGPMIACSADAQTIAPVTLEDAGGIAGSLVDAATRQPVDGATLTANKIDYDLHDRKLMGAGWTISDARGRFHLSGLPPGVYNLCLRSSPRGDRFTAQAVEGIRVKAGEDAPADLKLVAGRRLQGAVIDNRTGKPMGDVSVTCSSSALPIEGRAGGEAPVRRP